MFGRNDVSDYHFRAQYRRAMEEWLREVNFRLFVTLSFKQNVGLGRGRTTLGHWFGCVDSHYLGKGWHRRAAEERTVAVACPENIISNLHYHCLMRLPETAQSDSFVMQRLVLKRAWIGAAPGGTCHVREIDDGGASRYATKQQVRPDYWQHFVLASEFHTAAAGGGDRRRYG
jgi:hypothetical protein